MSGQPQVIVIGAGPTGLAAAAAAGQAGAAVTVVDEWPEPGGQLRYRVQPIAPAPDAPAERPRDIAARLIADAVSAGTELRQSALAAGVFAGNEVLIVEGALASRVVADALIVATGSTDLPFPFAGATFPGVFSARAIQILLNRWRIRPGGRFAIVGSGLVADELEVDILLAGGEVAWRGIAPAPFLEAHGRDGVNRLTTGQESVAVDVIAIAVGRQPDPALATMAGVPLAFSAGLGGLAPVVDARLRGPLPNLFVAGDAAGVGSVAVSIAEGRVAGLAAAAALGLMRDEEAIAAAIETGGQELAWRMDERAAMTATHAQPYA
jgi:thioredoxin reductase